MAVSCDPESWLGDTEPVPDLGFRIAFGSYVGVVAVEVLLAVAFLLQVGGEGVLALTGMVVFAVSGVAGGYAVGWWQHGPERIGRSRLRHLFVLPGVLVLAVQGLAWLADVGTILSPGLFLTSMAAMLFGGIIATMVRTRYVAARCSPPTARVSWNGRRSPRSLLRTNLFALTPVVVIVAIRPDVWLSVLPAFVGALTGVLVQTRQTVAVHDVGVSVRKDFNRRLFPWDQFDGYRLTDKELPLERSIRPDIGWRRSDIEDIEVVTDALDSQLDG